MLDRRWQRRAGVPVFNETNDQCPCAVLVQPFPHYLRKRIQTGRVFPKARSYAREFDSRDGAVRHTRGACTGTPATDKADGRHAYISRVSPVQQTQVSSLTFERGESRLFDDDEHHEMGGDNYFASGGVVPRGEQPGIGSYRRLCLGRPAGQASNRCRKVFMGGGFRSDRCAFSIRSYRLRALEATYYG